MSRKLTPFLIVLSLVPLLVATIAVFLILPDIIPTHAGLGGIDDYGSKYEAYWIAGILTACCLLFTFFYYFADALQARGLIHGMGTKSAQVSMVCLVVLFDVLSILAVLFWLSSS